MRIVFISDTHLQHNFSVPEGDLLVHSGDITMQGTTKELAKAAAWLNGVRIGSGFRAVVLTPGNHDFGFQTDEGLSRSLFHPAITILIHQPAEVLGIKFFGSPWTPEFFNWAFNAERGPDLARLWAQIPDDTQVLVTHGPPYGRLDWVPPRNTPDLGSFGGRDKRYPDGPVGCRDLMNRIQDLKDLRIHSFGHIHRPGIEQGAFGVTYINASTCNEQYRAVHKPAVIDFDGDKVTVVQGK